MKQAKHHWALAAVGGNVTSRFNLGIDEKNEGNMNRALKHFMIAVNGGNTNSVKEIQRMYMHGYATKDHYANALRSHQAYINEIKSEQRDKAAKFRDNFRYY